MGVILREVIPDGTDTGVLGEVFPDWIGLEFSQDIAAGTLTFNYPADGLNADLLRGGMFLVPVVDGKSLYKNSYFEVGEGSGEVVQEATGNVRSITAYSLLSGLEKVRWMPAIGSSFMDEEGFSYTAATPGAVIKAGVQNYLSRARAYGDSVSWISSVSTGQDSQWPVLVDEMISPTTSVTTVLDRYNELGLARVHFEGFRLHINPHPNLLASNYGQLSSSSTLWSVDYANKTTVLSSSRYEAFPRAVTLGNGTIVATWGSQTDHYGSGGASYGMMSTSTNGKTWTAAKQLGWGAVTPVALSRKGDRVAVLGMTRGPFAGYISVSSTPTTSFPTPTTIPSSAWGSPSWAFPADLEWIDDGTTNGIILATSYGSGGVRVASSSDAGATWEFRSIVNPQPFSQTGSSSEALLTKLADGRLLILTRNDSTSGNLIRAAWSSDNGLTWTPLVDVISGMTGQPKATVMPDGTLVATLRGGNSGWVLAESRDYGRTWKTSTTKLGVMMYGQVVISGGKAFLIGSTQNSASDADIWSAPLIKSDYQATLETTTRDINSRPRFTEGLNLVSGSAAESYLSIITSLLVVGGENQLSNSETPTKVVQWVQAPASVIETWGYREDILEVPEATVPETLKAIGAMYIHTRMEPRYSRSYTVVDHLYDARGNELNVPTALIDYEVGDMVTVEDGTTVTEERVCSLTLSWSNSHTPSVGITLNDYFTDFEVELDRRLKRLGG